VEHEFFATDTRFDPKRIHPRQPRSSGLFVAVEQSKLASMQLRYLGEFRMMRWEMGLAALSKFREREGHCCPSRHHVEGNFKLGDWVSLQRYRKDLMPRERKRRLDAIGFVWDWRDYVWEQNFAALLKFKRRKGHCCVPTFHREGDLELGWWVATQRRRRKEMSAERRARLSKIGLWRVNNKWGRLRPPRHRIARFWTR
jgi:hypothetical protein